MEMDSRVGTLPCFTKTITRIAITKDYPACLPIPKEFSDEQRGKLASEAVLKINSHKKWLVKIVVLKSSTYAFRGPGWTDFARTNELEIGDQVMFTLLNPGLFSVKITREQSGSDARRNVKVKQEQPEVQSAVAETAMPDEEEDCPTSKLVEDPAAAAATATAIIAESGDRFKPGKRTAQEDQLEHGPSRKAARVEDEELEHGPSRKASRVEDEELEHGPSRKASRVEDEELEHGPSRKASRVEDEELEHGPSREQDDEVHAARAKAPVLPQAAEARDMVTPARAARQSLGTAQDPLEIDLAGGGGAAEDAGIHLVLKTERKNFKVFISVSAMEAAAANTQAPEPEPDVTNNGGVVENPLVTSPDSPVTEPEENPANVLETKPVIPAATAAADAAAAAADTAPLPRITIPIRTTNVAPYSRLTIEKAFALRWLPPQTCTVKLVDRAGKEWEMRWIVAKKRMLTQGWSAIVKHYKMRVGDLCTLEVVNPKTLRFFVTDSVGAVVERQ